MASFNADILLKLTGVGRAEAEVKKLEKTINKVGDAAQKIAIGGLQGGTKLATRNVKEYINTLGKLDKRLGGLGGRLADVAKAFDFGGKTVVGIAGLNALSSALQALPRWAGGANSALQGFASSLESITAPINLVTDALQAMGPAGMATAGGIAATTAAVMAFGPAVRRAGKQAEEFRRSFSGSFEVSQDLLSEKTLRDALGAAVAEQKKLSAGTREYTQKTEEVLGIQRELTAELRRQQTVLNMVNKEQIDIAKNVQKNINASAQTRRASGFADFSQRAGAQTAIDKSIRRQQEKLARRAQSAPGQTGPLMLPSSEMLNAAERGIKRIRSVTDQLGEDLDYTNQEVANFINGLKNGANEAVKLPPIFNKVAQSLDVINKNFDSATAKAKRLAGGAAGGTGSTTPIQGRTAALKQLAALETKLIGEVAATRAKKDLQSYNTRQKRLRFLAAQEKKAAQERARLNESLLLGVGFPLLFGGGAGSVLGSAAGSFVGSGFGGQIAGGAIGQAIDGYLASLGELGSALNPLTADTDKLVEALGATNTPLASTIEKLEAAGRESEAFALATERMVDLVGQDGVDALREFGQTTTQLGNEFAKAMTLMNAGIAELLTNVGLFKALADQLGRANLINQARNSGNAEQAARFEEFEAAGTGSFGDPTGAAQRRAEIMQEIIDAQILINAEVEREAEIRERLAEFDAAKVREIRASVAEKEIELQIELLNAAANDETRIALEKKLAYQRLMTEQQALYNKFAKDQITIDVLRLKLAGARLDYEKQIASINNAAANYKPPRTGGGRGEDPAKKLERQLKAGERIGLQLRQRIELLNAESKLQERLIQIDNQREQAAIRIKETAAASQQAALLQQNAELGRLERAKALEEFGKRAAQSAEKFLETLRLQEEAEARKKELIEQGILPGLAEELIKIEQQADKLKTNLDLDIATLDAIRAEVEARGGNVEAIEKEIDALKKKKKEIEGAEAKAKEGAEKESSPRGRLEKEVEKQQDALNQLIDPVNQVVGAANAIGDAFGEAFRGIVDGSMSAQEAFANMAQKIGDYFLDMAAKMIAEYVKLILMQTILNAIGGPALGGGGGGAGPGGYTIPGAAVPKTSGMSFFADGGFVDRPTNAVIGEGGTNEYVIPAERMNGAMKRYSAGMRGDAVVDGASPTETRGGTAVAEQPTSINIEGGVMQFNDENYIRQDQIPSIVAQASKQGEARALRKMQMSPGTRKRVGI